LPKWVRHVERDARCRAGLISQKADRVMALEPENRAPRRAIEILRISPSPRMQR